MSYQKQTFIDNETVLRAAHLNHIEDGIVANETSIDQTREMIAPKYSSEGSYIIGNVVTNPEDGKLYRCITPVSAETWDANKWEEVTVNSLIDEKSSGASTDSSPDLLYKQIFGDDSDWAVNMYPNGGFSKTGRTFVMEGNSSSATTVYSVNLTGTTHTARNGNWESGSAATYDTDFIPIPEILKCAFVTSDFWRIGFMSYWDLEQYNVNTNYGVSFGIILRKPGADAGTYEYSDRIQMMQAFKSTSVNYPLDAVFSTTLVAGEKNSQPEYTIPWSDYTEMAIYFIRRNRVIRGTCVIEPFCNTISRYAAVLVDEQTLDDAQKRQARTNIGATPRLATEGIYAERGMHPNTAVEAYSGIARNVDCVINGTIARLNGTASTSGGGVLFSLLGYRVKGAAGSTVPNAEQLSEGPFPVTRGHTYRLRIRLVSGTTIGSTPYIILFDTEGQGIAGTMTKDETYYVMDRDEIGQFGLFSYKSASSSNLTTHTNAVYSIEFTDMTALSQPTSTAIAPSNIDLATQNYVAGNLLMRGGQLYKANNAIVSGTQIQDTDVTLTSVAQELAQKANTTSAVRYDEAQTLTDTETAQARANIDAVGSDELDGKMTIDKSDWVNAYPTGEIGSVIGFSGSAKSITFKRACRVEAGKTYTVIVHNAETVQSTTSRNTYITDDNGIVLQTVAVLTVAGLSIPTKFVANNDGWLYPCIDSNYVGFEIYGTETSRIAQSVGMIELRTALYNHAAGDVFTIDGQLYRAIKPIAIGDTIKEGDATDENANVSKDILGDRVARHDHDLYEKLLPQIEYWGEPTYKLAPYLGVKINHIGNRLYLDGTNTSKIWLKMSGEYARGSGSGAAQGWDCTVPLEAGVSYKLTSRLVSGSIEGVDNLRTYLRDSNYTAIATVHGLGEGSGTWTSGLGKIILEAPVNTVFTDAVFEVTLSKAEDLNVLEKIENATGSSLLAWDGNGRINNIGTVGATISFDVITDNAYRYLITECEAGDRFTITGYIGSAACLYTFFDADNKILLNEGAGSDRDHYVVTAPAGSAKLLMQCNNYKYGTFGSVYKGVFIPKTIAESASNGATKIPDVRWLDGGIDTTGFIGGASNKRTNGINFNPGERLIITNTQKDIRIAIYASKDGLFKLVGVEGYARGGGRFVLRDWTWTYYIRLAPYSGSTRPDPATGGYISVTIESDSVPYDRGYFKWCGYPQIGLHRTYSNVKPLLIIENKNIINDQIVDDSTACLVTLPNAGWVEVKQDGQSVQFKIAKVTDGVVSFLVSDWSYYTYRYWGDGESTYYALVTKTPGAAAGSDIMQLTRLYLGVYTFVDEGATYEHGYYLSGKHLAFIGDSITQGRFDKDGDSSHKLETTTSKSFCELVAEIAGDDDVGNYGIGGAYVVNTQGDTWKSLLTNCVKVSGYSTVFVCGGTNDYGNDVPEADFRAAYETILDTLMAANTQVVCCTPVYRTSKTGANSQGLWLSDYATMIKEIAAAKGLWCIDLLSLTADGCFTRFCPDGLHPNEMGHKVIADWIVRECDRLGLS